MTKEEAIAFDGWKRWPIEAAAMLQLHQDKLFIEPFSEFQRGMEKLLGRPVWTHEFARPDLLFDELLGAPARPAEALSMLGSKL